MKPLDAPAPALRDPVVVEGTKYRIRAIRAGVAELREHYAPHSMTAVRVDALVWDRVAGVWRVTA